MNFLGFVILAAVLTLADPAFLGRTSATISSVEPDDISGLQVWLKSESVSGADGSELAQWNDSSANAWHATNSVSAQRPYVTNSVLNGYAAAYFDGGDALKLPSTSVGILRNKTGCSAFAVVSRNSTAAGDKYIFHFCRNSAGSTRFLMGYTGNTNVNAGGRRLDTDSYATFGSTYPSPLTTFYVHEAIGNYSDSHGRMLINGTSVHENTSWLTDGSTSDTDGTDANWIGGSTPGFSPFTGWMAELIIYDRALSDTERQSVEAYINTKFAIW